MKNWQECLDFPQYFANIIDEAEEIVREKQQEIALIASSNQVKLLQAFRQTKVGDEDFQTTTGYGYNDIGREKIEKIFAQVFGGEAALVRPQLVSGTHAIACCLYGLLRPGNKFLSVTGKPYDTLQMVLGEEKNSSDTGSLRDFNIDFLAIDTIDDIKSRDKISLFTKLKNAATAPSIKLIYIQRSRGYALRPALTIADLEFLIRNVRKVFPLATVFVDNCYGEFVADREPLQVGADLIAGSLIKNPGGGLAPAGGYIVGNKGLVVKAAGRLTVPGAGMEMGPSLGTNHRLLQGFFLAPHFVGEALKGAVFAAALFEKLGFEVQPKFHQERGDLVQTIRFGKAEVLQEFCKQIQSYSPVNSHVVPVPAHMPGYERDIIMAAGTFVQGSSLELSADAPLAPPYTVFLQSGLVYAHSKAAISAAALGLVPK